MMDPLETAELLAFAKIVDLKSLSAAADALRVPRATISRRLARLESKLAARLLRRTTRSLALTDAGEALYRHARIVLDAVQQAESSVRRSDDAIRGDLRVSAPPIDSPSFQNMICGFAKKHPEVRLQVHLSTQLVDLSRGDYDVAIRATGALSPGLVARTLSRDAVIAVASPAYLAERGVPRSRKDLRNHRCLMGFARGEVPQTHWTFSRGQQHTEQHAIDGAFFSNDISLLCSAALRGMGIAFLPGFLVASDIEAGDLVQVMPGVLEAKTQIAVVYLEREFVPAQVRAFVDEVVAWASKDGLMSTQSASPNAARSTDIKTAAPRARRKRGAPRQT